METTKKDWLHFITGAVAALIVSAAVLDAVKSSANEQVFSYDCSCDCSSKFNLDDEIIYTMEVENEVAKFAIGDPPANPVILSK
jgi:hypothetical protein